MKLLKFHADWCGPCKMLTKVMSDIEFPYDVEVVNIDHNEELVTKYNVRGVPTLILLDNSDNVIATHIGAVDRTTLENTFINI